MPKHGVYIVLEGDEGAGKGTQAALLKDWLGTKGIVAEIVREPGGDPIGEQLRKILKFTEDPLSPLAEVYGFSMARANMLEFVVKPKLQAGTWVIGDRNFLSTLIYQGMGRGINDKMFWSAVHEWPPGIFKMIVTAATAPAVPDLTIVLDIPVEVSLHRLLERGDAPDRFEAAGDEFRRRVNEGYRTYAWSGAYGYAGVNGDQSVEEVHQDIVRLIQPLLKKD